MRFDSILFITSVAGLLFFSISCKKVENDEWMAEIVIPEAVDLGLSVKWASFDVGASMPGEVGYYISWGEIAPKTVQYNWKNYSWTRGGYASLIKYNYNSEFGKNPDYRVFLKKEDDIASVVYGGDWRMPTRNEIKELLEAKFLTKTVERVGDVDCLRITSSKTGQSIILPAGGQCWQKSDPSNCNRYGYFWSAELDYTTNPLMVENHDPSKAILLLLSLVDGEDFLRFSSSPRYCGENVRAVKGAEKE